MITFDQIDTHSFLVEENEFYQLYHQASAPYMYDYNFMQLKYQPTVEEFKLLEAILLDFHHYHDLEHIKFYWPEDKGFTEEIIAYFSKEHYGIEILELYAIRPENFSSSKENHAVSVSFVTEETLEDYQNFNQQIDQQTSQAFAERKQQLYEDNFYDPSRRQVIAVLNDQVVGTLDLILSDETVEIDNFIVADAVQKQGIGSEMQQFVLPFADQRMVLLVTDADSTAREMYVKQGYEYISYRLGAEKIIKEKPTFKTSSAEEH